jgi:hypothetical protein
VKPACRFEKHEVTSPSFQVGAQSNREER